MSPPPHCDHARSAIWLGLASLALLVATTTFAAGPVPDTQPISRRAASDDVFKSEVEAANQARRFDDRVRHLRTALAARPNDPGNIVAEVKLAIELTQRPYPPQVSDERSREGRAVFEHVVKTYHHKDYYNPNPTGGADDPEMMLPLAAILLSQLDGSNARAHALFAMDCLSETYRKRSKDWSTPHVEPPATPFTSGPREQSKRKSREAFYKKRQAAAAAGDVFNPTETMLVELAVGRFTRAYGLEQRSPVPLKEIIKRCPATPMSKLAEQRLSAAAAAAAAVATTRPTDSSGRADPVERDGP